MALDFSSRDEDSEVDSQWMEELGGCNKMEKLPDLDDDYFQFLTTDSKSMSKDKNCGLMDLDDDDEEVDPRYEKFLASLKVDGFSYVLEPDDFNKLDKPLRFGADDSSDDEEKINTWGNLKDVNVGENTNELQDFCSDSRGNGPEILGFLPGKRRTELVAEKDVLAESLVPVPSDERSPVGEFNPISDNQCNSDAQGGSSKRQDTQSLGKSEKVSVGQEETEKRSMPADDIAFYCNGFRTEQCLVEDPASDSPSKFDMRGGSTKRQNMQVLGKSGKDSNRQEETENRVETGNECIFSVTSPILSIEESPVEEFDSVPDSASSKFDMQSRAKRQKTQVLGKSRKVACGQEGREISLMPGNNNLRSKQCPVEEYSPVSDRPSKFNMPGGSKKRQKRQVLQNLEEVSDGQKETEGVPPDHDYSLYLKGLKIEGPNLIYADGSLEFAYESDKHLPNCQTDDSRSLGKGNSEHSMHAQEFDPILDGDNSCQYLDSPSSKKHSEFREQIMRILREPYNPKELKIRMNEIMARKPVGRFLDLRNGRERHISGNKKGKSYLDHYGDLKLKLQAAKDNHKKLNLLRGFFFWIQKVTTDGEFKPWRDPECLAM